MGNCICSKSAESSISKLEFQEQEEDQMFEYIHAYFAKFPAQETITLKIKTSMIRHVFEGQSHKSFSLNSSLDDITNEIRKLTKKRFVLLNVQQDPVTSDNLILVFVNEQVAHRYDLSENTFVKPSCFSVKRENIFMRGAEIREEQILNLVRDFYQDSNSLVIGGYQDQKDPTQYNFILFSSHESLDFGAKFVTPYFLSIECVENLDQLETVIDAYEESVLQTVLTFNDGEKLWYYLIFKDLEYLAQRTGFQYHAESLVHKDLLNLRLRNSKINNIHYVGDKLYYISYGQYKHSMLNIDTSSPVVKRGKTHFVPRKIRESIKVKNSIREVQPIQDQQMLQPVPINHRQTVIQKNEALDAIQEDEESEHLGHGLEDIQSHYSQSQYVRPTYTQDYQKETMSHRGEEDSDEDLVREVASIQKSINEQDQLFMSQQTLRGDRRSTMQVQKSASQFQQSRMIEVEQVDDFESQRQRDEDELSDESFATVMVGHADFESILKEMEGLPYEERQSIMLKHRQTMRLLQDKGIYERSYTVMTQDLSEDHHIERKGTVVQRRQTQRSHQTNNRERKTIKLAKQTSEQEEEGQEDIQYREELRYTSKDDVSSFITEFYEPKGKYFLNYATSLEGDSICHVLDDLSKITLVGSCYIHSDVALEGVNQQSLSYKVESKEDLEKVFGVQLEYVGVQDHWKLYRLIHSEREAFIYLSLCEAVIANCMYEVQFYKSLRTNEEFFSEEAVFLWKEQISGYAVVVSRPYMDLQSLINIWKKTDLAKRKQEQFSMDKLNYIMFQVLDNVRSLQNVGVRHNNLKLSSILVDIKSYSVLVGSYCFAQQESTNQRRGQIKSLNENNQDIEDVNEFIINYCNGYLQLTSPLPTIQDIDTAVEYYRGQIDVDRLVSQLLNEEKHSPKLIESLSRYFHVPDITSVFALSQDGEYALSDLQNQVLVSNKLQIAQQLLQQNGIRRTIQIINTRDKDGHYLLLVTIQDMIESGRILQAVDLFNHFESFINAQTDIIGVYLRFIKADIFNEDNTCEQINSLSKRQQVLASLLLWQQSDHQQIESARQIIQDIDHGINPLLSLLESITSGASFDRFLLNMPGLPSYFIQRLQLNSVNEATDQQQRADTVNHFRVINIFKTIKSLLTLLTYHQSVIQLDQYETKNLHLSVYQFGLDLFSSDYHMKNKVHEIFSGAYQTLFKEHLLEVVIDHLTSRTFTQFKSVRDYRQSVFARFNFLLTLMQEDIERQSDAQLQVFYSKYFNVDNYTQVRKMQHPQSLDFIEYLSMIIGLRETNRNRYKQLEEEFI